MASYPGFHELKSFIGRSSGSFIKTMNLCKKDRYLMIHLSNVFKSWLINFLALDSPCLFFSLQSPTSFFTYISLSHIYFRSDITGGGKIKGKGRCWEGEDNLEI